MVTDNCFQNMTEKGFENREMKEKCAEEDWYFEGTFWMDHLGSGSGSESQASICKPRASIHFICCCKET
jgi:hypothetical protein